MDNSTQSVPVNLIPSSLHGIIYFIIGVFAVGGNIANLLVVPKISTFPESAKAFIKLLSGCDLLVGITILGNAPSAMAERWLFGDKMCIVFTLLLNFSASAGSTILLFMNIDRLFAVSKPFHHVRYVTENKVYTVCSVTLLIWLVVSLLYASDNTFLDNTGFSWIYRKCFHKLFDLEQVYAIVFLGIFFTQCFILVIIYFKLLRITLGKKSHRVAALPASLNGDSSVQQDRPAKLLTSNGNQGESAALQGSIGGNDHKAIRTTLLVTGAFLGSWIPYSTAGVLVLLGIKVPAEVHAVCSMAVVCNSWWNTVVYSICNRSFREKFKRLFKR